MITCDNCRLILEPDTIYCPRCGRKLVSGPRKQLKPPDPRIRPLLNEAKTLRTRGSWDEAVEKCIDALKLDPESVDVYVALGEIYEAQGRLDQALQWYQMAEAECAAAGKPTPDLQDRIRRLMSRRTAAHQTTGWFDRFVGGSRFSSSMRIITTAMVGFLILLILGAVFVIYADRMRDRRMSTPGAHVPVSPGNSSQRTADSGSPAYPQRANTNVQQIPRIVNPRDEASNAAPDKKLVTILAQDPVISQRRIGINEVVIDPRHKQTIVQFRISPASGTPRKEDIMTDCAAVCAAAYRLDTGAVYVTVCALADLPDGAGGYGLTPVFVADTNRQTAAEVNPSMAPAELEQLFSNPWWNPQVSM